MTRPSPPRTNPLHDRPHGCTLNNTYVMAGGKFAVYHFNGRANQIYAAFQSLFSVWLPLSGCEIDDRYGCEIYQKVDCDSMRMEVDL